MKLLPKVVLGALVLALIIAGPFIGIRRDDRTPELSAQPSEAAAVSLSTLLRERVSDSGRVKDGQDSPRNQSLALLVAATAGDKSKFLQIWNGSPEFHGIGSGDATSAQGSGMLQDPVVADRLRAALAGAVLTHRIGEAEPGDDVIKSIARQISHVDELTPTLRYYPSPVKAELLDSVEPVSLNPTLFREFYRVTLDPEWNDRASSAERILAKTIGDFKSARLPADPVLFRESVDGIEVNSRGQYTGSAQELPMVLASQCELKTREYNIRIWTKLRKSNEIRAARALTTDGKVVDGDRSIVAIAATGVSAAAAKEQLQSAQLFDQADELVTEQTRFDERALLALSRASVSTTWMQTCRK